MTLNHEKIEKIEKGIADKLDVIGINLIQKERIYPTAAIASQVFEDSENATIQAFCLTTMWLFGIDRWFDERTENSDLILESCERVVSASVEQKMFLANAEEYELAAVLRDIRTFLNLEYQPEILQTFFVSDLLNTIFVGMAFVHSKKNMANAIGLISFEEYLPFASESIGLKLVNTAVLISMKSKFSFKNMISFRAMQNKASEIIRLANDRVTYRKEVEEGNINAVLILGKNNLDTGLELVNEEIKKRKEEFERIILASSQEMKKFADYLRSLVETTLAFYEKADFYSSKKDYKKM